jgi:hypothetical protein
MIERIIYVLHWLIVSPILLAAMLWDRLARKKSDLPAHIGTGDDA